MKTGYTKTARAALDEMRLPGRALLRTNRRNGDEWSIFPGGRIDTKVAHEIIKHPLISAQLDSLFPGLSQTWRHVGQSEGGPHSQAVAAAVSPETDRIANVIARQGDKRTGTTGPGSPTDRQAGAEVKS
jgi:hypothetical protein